MDGCSFPPFPLIFYSSSAATAVQGAGTVDGTGQIWLDSITCAGYETRLTDCRNDGFGVHNCTHSQDVGVICQGERCLKYCATYGK